MLYTGQIKQRSPLINAVNHCLSADPEGDCCLLPTRSVHAASKDKEQASPECRREDKEPS